MESKSVRSTRRKYDAEFKKEVIRMIESGRTVPDVAQSLRLGSCLHEPFPIAFFTNQ